MDGTDIQTCSGFFTDSGGDSGPYQNNESYQTTICSDGSVGTHVRLQFFQVDIDALDLLCFYDGPTTAAPSLDCHIKFTDAFIIQATAANPSGCITVTFESDGSGIDQGWYAAISCVASCQLIRSSMEVIEPPMSILDTGYNFIDVCPGQPITLSASGVYPQNNLNYEQADSTSVFSWDFGNGNFASGPTVTTSYPEPGGYELQVRITDTVGCISTNYLNTFVRVSGPPQYIPGADMPAEVCPSDTVRLSAAVGVVDTSADLSAFSWPLPYLPGDVRADSLALPDGNGVAYETSILLTEYLPGAVLENVLDLFGICIVMEHSWMRDLLITITCPSGISVTLQEHLGNSGTEIFLGEPYEDDEGMEPVPGVGYEYCWTPTATNGTWLEYVQATGTDELPAGDYSSYDPLDNLLGCPLNGEWTITIEDLWGFDNGFVFSWGISLNPDLLANKDSFFVELVDNEWLSNKYTLAANADSISFSAPFAGSVNVPFQTTDAFGCVFDTVLTVDIRSPLDPECFSCPESSAVLQDSEICPGDTVVLDAALLQPNTDSTVTFEFVGGLEVPAIHRMGTNPFSAELVVKDLAPAFLADPQSRICSVCMDLETPQTANLQVWLESPGGQILELTNFNGDGQNYTNTCFVPGSAAPVSAASPPFSGSFAPDGNWSVLTGTPVNGTWKLLLSDTTGQSVLRSWSICLGNDNEVTWQWIPDTGLSCQDCPTPLAFPEFSNTWIVEAKDRYGCVSYDSASIEVKSVLNSPVPDCSVPDEGQLLFSWSPVTGAAGYLIAVDNGPWQAPSGAQSHLVTGLADGAMVTLALTVIPQPDFCTADTVLVTCQYVDPCPLSLSVDSVSPPSCFNTADGSVTLKVQGNLGPLEYKLEAETPFQQNPEFQGLGPGTYLAVVRDSAACADSVIFVVAAPDTLYLSLSSTDVTCHGSATGSIQSVVTNAQGALTYNWSGPGGYGSALPEAVQLVAGAYCLEIVDGNACAQTACDTIFEPSAIAIIPSLTMPRCHDTDDGALSVVATGGTPGYVVQWNDPLNTQGAQLENVTSGIYTLTVTDGAGCDSSFTLELPGPPPLVLDQIIKSQVSCKGLSDGSLLVEVSGGTPPYAYLWSDPSGQQTSLAVALEEGSYEVTITDSNDCELTASATLDAPDSISVFGSISPANCSGDSSGAISVAPQGGTSPYAFSWSAGLPDSSLVTSLPAGLYTVTVVDGAGCEGTASFEVTEPDPLVVVVSVEEASCANTTDGSAEAVVEGGTAPYALEWSQGATGENLIGIGAGLYGVTVTDALGCQFTAQALVGAPDSVSGLVDASPPSCFDSGDGSLSIAGVGGMAPFIYSLDQSPFSPVGLFQNLDAGFYKVVVQDANGCEWENEVHIIAPDPLIVDAGPDLVIELGDSIVLGYMATGAQGDIQSVWTASYSGTLLCDTCLYCDQTQVLCSEPIAKPSYTIWYTIRVVDEKGCEAEDLVKVSVEKNRDVFVPTGFTPNGDGQNDVLVVHGEQETRIVLFKIFDRWGECVFENGDFQAQDILSGWDGTFHGQPMPAGTYVWYLEAEFSDKARLIYQGETTLIR